MVLKLFFIVVLFAVSLNADINYCDKKLCSDGNHVACKHKGKFAPSCPSGIKLITINKDLQTAFLLEHNKIRDLVASGKHPKGFKKAVRMCSMVWDPTLAFLASLNAMTCTFAHDDCVMHYDYASIGQNIFKANSGAQVSDADVIKKAMEKWHKEADDAAQSNLDKLGGKRGIGHFTQVVGDRACKVGCALARWSSKGKNQFYIMCNYSISNVVGCAAYNTKGDKCKTGYHPNYPSLCSVNEADIIQKANKMAA